MNEAEIETTPEGQVPVGGGWFVLNLGEMAWETYRGSAPGAGSTPRTPIPQRRASAYTSTSFSPASPTATTTPKLRRKGSSFSAASASRSSRE